MPPIFQPEVAARAIVWAAHHRRRELYVGFPTVEAIAGERLVPRALDHHLGRVGYDAQQTDAPVAADRADNLWAPVPGDHGALGAFDARAKERSLELWMSMHRGLVGAAFAVCAGGVAAVLSLSARRWW